jgi:hypothetical protein
MVELSYNGMAEFTSEGSLTAADFTSVLVTRALLLARLVEFNLNSTLELEFPRPEGGQTIVYHSSAAGPAGYCRVSLEVEP